MKLYSTALSFLIFCTTSALAQAENEAPVFSFAVVDQIATFPECTGRNTNDEKALCLQEGILKHIQTNLKYPEKAKKEKVQGKVYVSFVVSVEGRVEEVEVSRGVHPELDREAIRVVKSLPQMRPAVKDANAVRMSYIIPISYKLQ